jgi:hypothetical protein
MIISRRQCLSGSAALIASPALGQFRLLRPLGSAAGYQSTLVNGYTPQFPTWQGLMWSADMGSTWNKNMNYCWQATTQRSRFEVHNSPYDRAQDDDVYKRRSELHANKNPVPNNTSLWGAFSFIDQPWSDPLGMSKTTGGSLVQMHGPDGGSPPIAFRRWGTGHFVVTTVGDLDSNNHKRYDAPLSFNTMHDLVYRCVLSPNAGQLDVWLDGKQIVSLKNQSIGFSKSGCYICMGPYFPSGVTCPVVVEYGNWARPGTASLSSRISHRPVWPTN